MRLVSTGVWIGLLMVLVAVPVAHAAPGEPAGSQPAPQAPAGTPLGASRVLINNNAEAGGDAWFGDSLRVQVGREELTRLLGSKDRLRLYLDAQPIPALAVYPDSTSGELRFVLARNDKNRSEWAGLLNAWREREVQVGVGLDAGPQLVGGPIHMRLFPAGRTVIWLGLALLLVLGTWVVARTTPLLRDPVPAGSKIDLKDRVYSLGRTQMAWWTGMTVLALLALWWITGNVEPVSGSMLALMGIGAGTFLSAVLIDSGQPATGDEEKKRARRGFFYDLLSENGSEISLHRLQMMVWTVVVTVAFWTAVVNQLSLPEIDPTLLGLLGISNGTYLGFKLR